MLSEVVNSYAALLPMHRQSLHYRFAGIIGFMV
jgi:hypothetical protein